MNFLTKALMLCAAHCALSTDSLAQDDITSYYMVNGDFDQECTFKTTRVSNVGGNNLYDIYGWTKDTQTWYILSGTFEYNGTATIDGGWPIPEAGYDGKPGGGLAFCTGWNQTIAYKQNVTLPKGTYHIATAAYNTGTSTAGTLTLSWTPNGGTTVKKDITNLPIKSWKTDGLDITLDSKKTGTLSIGFTSTSDWQALNAKPIVDYVHILTSDMDLTTPLAELKKAITAATTQYADGTKANAHVLKAVIDRAQAIYDDPAHSPLQVLGMTDELKQATQDNKMDCATPEQPMSLTSLITNPSFESGTTGWTSRGMNTQTNSYFTKKAGNTYAEAWTPAGGTLGERSLTQTIIGIPAGRYRLKANALHIQQKSGNSTINKGDDQTGAWLVAGNTRVPVTAMQEYAIDILTTGGDLTIGLMADGATGNWICVDNFRLEYTGRLTTADRAAALQALVQDIEATVLTQRISAPARQAMDAAIAAAQAAIDAATGEALDAALAQIDAATATCRASAKLFRRLQFRLDYAAQVMGWIEGNASKTAKMQAAIDEATARRDDLTLTDEQATDAINALNASISSIYKGIYTADWSLGDVTDPNNRWSLERSVENKDWVLFWEKGYGDEVPVNFYCGSHCVNAYETLEHAQTAFDFYADSLKYINRSKSKTNQYKMIIKLRYEESEWEATGSGIDDLIGLLTLTPWAQTSRNWQTVYHEVGHCFQYQTHCDNGDKNGWMYNIGSGTAFWEQCAQWQAYKIMPYDQFDNEWYSGYMANTHKHILHESPRYNNYFIQDYWCMKHGMDFLGKMWNQSKDPEDAVQTYQRLAKLTNKKFNDEMWDCAARFATWDIPHLMPYHKDTWKNRPQPTFTKDKDKYWVISPDNAPENTGHNIIKLNVPKAGTEVTACFEGLAGDSRYRDNYAKQAGWRYGFVALLKDGTRVYGDMGSKANYRNPQDTVRFEVPANCSNLWFVVTGACTTYHIHAWDDDDSNDEQYGYRVRFDSTNLQGQTNDHITAIDTPEATAVPTGVYTLTGVRLRNDNDTQGLPAGIYIVGGRRVAVR